MSVNGYAFEFRQRLSNREARTAARAVRQASRGREALNAARPRGATGLFRARAPVAIQLRLAAQQGRLAWASTEAFAVLESPGHYPAKGGGRWLRFLDRGWDVLLFAVPPGALLGTAGLLALLPNPASWTRLVAIGAALTAVLYVLVPMTGVTVSGFSWLYRTLIRGRTREVTESGIGQIRASYWSISLCHLPKADAATAAGALLETAQARVDVASDPGEPRDVLLAVHGVTSQEALDAIRHDRHVDIFSEDPPFLIVRPDLRLVLTLPEPPAKIAGQALRGIPWLVGGMAVVLAVLAEAVPAWEDDVCRRRWPADVRAVECAEQPRQYLDALYWLLNRLSGGDPEGLGVQSFQARTIGLLVTLMSVVIVGFVITGLLQQAVARTQRFGQDVADAYNKSGSAARAVSERANGQDKTSQSRGYEQGPPAESSNSRATAVASAVNWPKAKLREVVWLLGGIAAGFLLGRRRG